MNAEKRRAGTIRQPKQDRDEKRPGAAKAGVIHVAHALPRVPSWFVEDSRR